MLEGKVSIVTGAASGIGLAAAQALSESGVHVVLADINEEKLKVAAKGMDGIYVAADLSKREDCRKLVDSAMAQYNKVDILVNVAGLQTVCPVEDFPEDKWDFMIALMLTAPFLLTKYCWQSMKESGWGRVINLNSIHGLVASEFKSAYVSAKHGLLGFTKTAALEGGPHGITVNSICPAYVKTPLVEGQITDQAKLHGISEEDVIRDIMLAKASVKSLLTPETVAGIVKFLCSDLAANITGIALPIDGGWTAG